MKPNDLCVNSLLPYTNVYMIIILCRNSDGLYITSWFLTFHWYCIGTLYLHTTVLTWYSYPMSYSYLHISSLLCHSSTLPLSHLATSRGLLRAAASSRFPKRPLLFPIQDINSRHFVHVTALPVLHPATPRMPCPVVSACSVHRQEAEPKWGTSGGEAMRQR